MSPYMRFPEAIRSAVFSKEVLARPSRHYDHCVAPPFKALLQFTRESFEGKRNFRNETKISLAVNEGRIGRDESGVAAHELYQPDAVARSLSLSVGHIDSAARFGNGCLETEGPLNKGDIIVDRLRDANDAKGHPCRFASADPKRELIGDDEHCWSDEGIFNIEGGCFAKAVNLTPQSEPDIFAALRFGAVLKNVVLDHDRPWTSATPPLPKILAVHIPSILLVTPAFQACRSSHRYHLSHR
jgi:hypothetical protein